VAEFQQKLEGLEAMVVEEDNAQPPWETDEELKAMKPTDIKACFENEEEEPLSRSHRLRLNEMCVGQLSAELSDKCAREVSMGTELEALQKEVSQLRTQLRHANAKRLVASQLIRPSSEEEGVSSELSYQTARSSTAAAAGNQTGNTGMSLRSRSRASLDVSEINAADSFVNSRTRKRRKQGAAGSSLLVDQDTNYDSESSVASGEVQMDHRNMGKCGKKQKTALADSSNNSSTHTLSSIKPKQSSLSGSVTPAVPGSASKGLAKEKPKNPFGSKLATSTPQHHK